MTDSQKRKDIIDATVVEPTSDNQRSGKTPAVPSNLSRSLGLAHCGKGDMDMVPGEMLVQFILDAHADALPVPAHSDNDVLGVINTFDVHETHLSQIYNMSAFIADQLLRGNPKYINQMFKEDCVDFPEVHVDNFLSLRLRRIFSPDTGNITYELQRTRTPSHEGGFYLIRDTMGKTMLRLDRDCPIVEESDLAIDTAKRLLLVYGIKLQMHPEIVEEARFANALDEKRMAELKKIFRDRNSIVRMGSRLVKRDAKRAAAGFKNMMTKEVPSDGPFPKRKVSLPKVVALSFLLPIPGVSSSIFQPASFALIRAGAEAIANPEPSAQEVYQQKGINMPGDAQLAVGLSDIAVVESIPAEVRDSAPTYTVGVGGIDDLSSMACIRAFISCQSRGCAVAVAGRERSY
jgi:hypothetical protein